MTAVADRLPRLLALVPYLLAHPGSRLPDVAAIFGITERQLRSDLDLLWVCGLPGQGPGDLIDVELVGDTVTLSNADTIARPLRLSRDEALSLLVALRTLADLPGLTERAALDGALAKIERAAGDSAGDSARVAVSVEAPPDVLATLQEARARQRRVHLRYYVPGRDETTERDVDPMRLLMADGRWYLEGWCRSVEAVRLFRLDRIEQLAVLPEPAEPPPAAQPRDLRSGLYAPAPDDLVVELELDPAARWVADYYPCESGEEAVGGRLRVRLRTPDTRWLRRLALRLGGTARVLAPAELAEEVRSEAAAALAAYAVPAPAAPAPLKFSAPDVDGCATADSDGERGEGPP